MVPLTSIVARLEQLAPPALAAEWDNVGLLVGDRARQIGRVMTCLTVTPDTATEAVRERADLIVSHHPMPFHSLRRITAETAAGRILLGLIGARVAVYSPHTAFDSAADGINQRLAQGLALRGITPLVPHPQGQGSGRWGWLEEPLGLEAMAGRVKQFLRVERLEIVGDPDRSVRTVAVACGAAGEFLTQAEQTGCDCLVLGEARFHTCLEAEAAGIGLILPGHFASERFGVEQLAETLARAFPDLCVWPSRDERDPLRLV